MPERTERGTTLVELLVTSAITLILLYTTFLVFNSTQNAANTAGAIAVNSSNAHIALLDLENNLRFADGVWIGGSGSSTTLTVSNASGSQSVAQPSCAQWAINSSNNLTELSTTGGSTAAVVMNGVTAFAGTNGFSQPTGGLIELDLTVNTSTAASNAVSVHDLVSPSNVATAEAVSSQCTA